MLRFANSTTIVSNNQTIKNGKHEKIKSRIRKKIIINRIIQNIEFKKSEVFKDDSKLTFFYNIHTVKTLSISSKIL